MQWCYECDELGLPNIKGQRKDRPRGFGKDTSPAGRLSGCFSQIKEIRAKTDLRGRERVNEREGDALDYLLVKGLDLGLHI